MRTLRVQRKKGPKIRKSEALGREKKIIRWTGRDQRKYSQSGVREKDGSEVASTIAERGGRRFREEKKQSMDSITKGVQKTLKSEEGGSLVEDANTGAVRYPVDFREKKKKKKESIFVEKPKKGGALFAEGGKSKTKSFLQPFAEVVELPARRGRQK